MHYQRERELSAIAVPGDRQQERAARDVPGAFLGYRAARANGGDGGCTIQNCRRYK